jgi:hypothetical protein
MALTDLPADWPALPITRADLLPDVLDLVVSDRARATGSLCLLICDPADRLVSPMQISHLRDAPVGADRAALLRTVLDAVVDIEPHAGVLAAIGRPGGLSATNDDRDWAEALAAATAGRIRLLGVHIVTADGSRPVPMDRLAA